MKLYNALSSLKNEDSFYDQASKSYQIYKKNGGTTLSDNDFLRLFEVGASPQHVARKEIEFKEKMHVSKEIIKKKINSYFDRKLKAQ